MSRRAPRFSDGSRLAVGSIVLPVRFVPGSPVGLTTGTRCVVREMSRSYEKVRVERDDGAPGTWWLYLDAIEGFGRGAIVA